MRGAPRVHAQIEESFHAMKAWLRSRRDWLSRVDAVTAITTCAHDCVNGAMASNFIRHSGYNMDADMGL